MRHSLLLLSITLLFLSGCAVKLPVEGHTPRSTFGKATGPDGWESAFWGAVQAKDWARVERHMATNYVMTSKAGRADKVHALADLKRLDLTTFKISDFETVPEGQDYVVTYTLTLAGSRDGRPLSNPTTRMLSVWQMEKKGEVLIAQSESDIHSQIP